MEDVILDGDVGSTVDVDAIPRHIVHGVVVDVRVSRPNPERAQRISVGIIRRICHVVDDVAVDLDVVHVVI